MLCVLACMFTMNAIYIQKYGNGYCTILTVVLILLTLQLPIINPIYSYLRPIEYNAISNKKIIRYDDEGVHKQWAPDRRMRVSELMAYTVTLRFMHNSVHLRSMVPGVFVKTSNICDRSMSWSEDLVPIKCTCISVECRLTELDRMQSLLCAEDLVLIDAKTDNVGVLRDKSRMRFIDGELVKKNSIAYKLFMSWTPHKIRPYSKKLNRFLLIVGTDPIVPLT